MKKIGPAAEDATLPFAKYNDFWLRNDAIGVLAEIGGDKSLRVLKHKLDKTFAHGNPLETGPLAMGSAAIRISLPIPHPAAIVDGCGTGSIFEPLRSVA